MVCCQFCFNLPPYFHLHLDTSHGCNMNNTHFGDPLRVESCQCEDSQFLKHDMFFVLETEVIRRCVCLASLCSEVPLVPQPVHFVILPFTKVNQNGYWLVIGEVEGGAMLAADGRRVSAYMSGEYGRETLWVMTTRNQRWR